MTGILQAAMAGGIPTYDLTISSDQTDYNWTTALTAAGWNGVSPFKSITTINAGVYVYATSTGGYGFNQGGAFPAGSNISLVINGEVHGKGGAGGAGNVFLAGAPGAVGGPALKLDGLSGGVISVTGSGAARGGGGGGGGGGSQTLGGPPFSSAGGGGGGGAGKSPGAGGAGAHSGNPGGTTTGGTGGAGDSTFPSGAGGNGGNSGSDGSAGGSSSLAGGAGGSHGLGVQGYSNASWSGPTIDGGTAG